MIGIFLIIWGLIFAGIPIYSYIEASQNGDTAIPLFVVAIFGIIGVIAFFLGIYNFFFFFRKKFIAKIGTETVATFLDMQVGYKQNDTNMYVIRYFFTDENNIRHEEKSSARFRFQQAYYFKTLYHFKIRYKGRHAVITEPLDFEVISKLPQTEEESYLKSKSQNSLTSPTIPTSSKKIVPKIVSKISKTTEEDEESYSRPYNQKQYFTCDYCGYVQDSPGRCLSCGARIKPKK